MLIQKSYKTVGTDAMDRDSMVRPLHEDAIIGSVIDASSRGDPQLTEHIGGVTIRRFVSKINYIFS